MEQVALKIEPQMPTTRINFGGGGNKEIKVISGNKVCAKFKFNKVDGGLDN